MSGGGSGESEGCTRDPSRTDAWCSSCEQYHGDMDRFSPREAPTPVVWVKFKVDKAIWVPQLIHALESQSLSYNALEESPHK